LIAKKHEKNTTGSACRQEEKKHDGIYLNREKETRAGRNAHADERKMPTTA